MRKILTTTIFVIVFSCLHVSVHAQILELIRLVTTEVIKAMDLEVQKQQNRVLALQVSQRMVENTLSENKLSEIESWMNKQKELTQEYYGSFKKVSGAFKEYKKIGTILSKRSLLIKRYSQIVQELESFPQPNTGSLKEVNIILDELLDKGLRSIERMQTIIDPGSVTISDAGRLNLLNSCLKELDQVLLDLDTVRQSVSSSSAIIKQNERDNKAIKQLHGL